MKRKKAFTLIELLVVVAIIALLISILLPSLSRARELSKRTVCSANLRGIAQACKIYANDYEDAWPYNWPENLGTILPIAPFDGTNYIGSTNLRKKNAQEITSTSCLWLLTIVGGIAPKQFICPSAGHVVDPTTRVDAYKDFTDDKNVSYGYQWPWDQETVVVAGSFRADENKDANMALIADRGPYGRRSGYDDIDGPMDAAFTLTEGSSPAQWEPFNSKNHQREGQNVAYQDGHVEFIKKPTVGVNNDNIYTVWNTQAGSDDPPTEEQSVLGQKLQWPGQLPGGMTDTCIWP